VHARKPELALEDLRQQHAALQQLARDGRRYVLLSAEQPPDEMARVAFREVVRFLTERQNRAAQP
jgi:transcription elongation GreA/GreB family factor